MKTKAALFILVSSFLINSSFSQSLGIQVGITGEFYSVYSGVRDFSPGGQAFGMNSFLIKGTNDTVWVFGTGCGNKTTPGDTSDVTFYREKDTGSKNWDCIFNAVVDAQYADTVITQYFGLTRANVKLQYIVPHAHSDHAAPEYIDALNTIGYPVSGTNVYVHVEDSAMIGCTQPCCGSTPCEDRATDKWFGASYNPPWPAALLSSVVVMGQSGDSCNAVINTFTSSALGTWKVMSGVDTSQIQSHTGGTVDLLNDTHNWHIVGSNLSLWAQCEYGSSYTKIDIHDALSPLTTSINMQGEQSNVISVYPNPASSELYISENLPLQPTDIYLMDVLGRRKLTLAPDARQIDVSNTPAGIKTLVIVTNEAVYTNRISIVR
ncbi:MAG TPA: T9SS type A sorting domain-containing protein [Flavobacteriales bacterium]|nr:T9SS type A sorting domain-containing protein [Flavobacteriales bacterium]